MAFKFGYIIGLVTILLASSSQAMDYTDLASSEKLISSCEIEKIRAVTTTSLKQHPTTLFYIALQCPNAKEILDLFNRKTWHGKPGAETFAQLVNKQHSNQNSFTGSPYLDILIANKKFK
jgi:hypothetical protein